MRFAVWPLHIYLSIYVSKTYPLPIVDCLPLCCPAPPVDQQNFLDVAAAMYLTWLLSVAQNHFLVIHLTSPSEYHHLIYSRVSVARAREIRNRSLCDNKCWRASLWLSFLLKLLFAHTHACNNIYIRLEQFLEKETWKILRSINKNTKLRNYAFEIGIYKFSFLSKCDSLSRCSIFIYMLTLTHTSRFFFHYLLFSDNGSKKFTLDYTLKKFLSMHTLAQKTFGRHINSTCNIIIISSFSTFKFFWIETDFLNSVA